MYKYWTFGQYNKQIIIYNNKYKLIKTGLLLLILKFYTIITK